jgi:hypothetical protein
MITCSRVSATMHLRGRGAGSALQVAHESRIEPGTAWNIGFGASGLAQPATLTVFAHAAAFGQEHRDEISLRPDMACRIEGSMRRMIRNKTKRSADRLFGSFLSHFRALIVFHAPFAAKTMPVFKAC